MYLRPAKSKTKGRITEARGITSETSRYGQPGGHLTESSHDEEDDETDESVADEDGTRTSLGESLAGTDNQTCTDSTSDGNHGNVTSLETAVKRRLGAGLKTGDVDRAGIVDSAGFGIVAKIRLLDVRRRAFDEATHDGDCGNQ